MAAKPTKKETPRLGAALALARRGWRVFPAAGVAAGKCACGKKGCKAAGKHPLTADGFKAATTMRKQIEPWWRQWPDANVAVATGAGSGVWVLDADGDEGVRAVAALEKKYGPLPKTPAARTGGGGRHYYFAVPSTAVKSSTKLGGKPLDVRGEGGYVLVPPSAHKSGADYAWVVSPDEAQPAAAPAWLLEFVTTKRLPAVKRAAAPAAVNGMVLRVQEDLDLATAAGAPEGERHARALALVGAHLARGEGAAEVTPLALAWAARCEPPFPQDELLRIVGDLAAKEGSRAVADEAWEPPIRLDDRDLPPFPTDALPPWLRRFVEAEATATQTPPDLAALIALPAVAVGCAKKVQVRVNAGYAEPVNLFTAVALPPANRKSSVFADVTEPIRAYEREETRRLGPEIAAARNRAKVAEARLAAAQRLAATGPADDQARLLRQAEFIAREMDEAVVPRLPRLLAEDATPEALASLLAENQGRLAVLSPEGDVFDLMAGRYGRGVPNLGVYLQGHAGDDLRVDRKNREPEFVRQPALTLGLTVQPDVILGLGARRELRGRGLLARVLYALPKTLLGGRDPDPPAVPKAVRDAYRANVTALLALAVPAGEAGDFVTQDLVLSPEAEQERIRFAGRLEPLLAPGGELWAIQDWAGKLAGAVLRIAGLLHMAEYAREPAPWERPVAGETLRKAARIGDYLLEHARAAFALMGADPVVEDAKAVLAWVKRKGQAAFSERDAFEGLKGHFKKVEALRPALALLAEHHYVRPRGAAAKAGPGRRPSPVFEVNPALWGGSQNSQNSQNPPTPGRPAKSANSAKNAKPSRRRVRAADVDDDDDDAIPAAAAEFEEGVL